MKKRLVLLAVLILAAVFLSRVLRSTQPVQPQSETQVIKAVEEKASLVASSQMQPSDVVTAARAAPDDEEVAITATAQIRRGDMSVVEARATDGEFERVHVEPNELLQIRLSLQGFDASQPIRIDVDNGGSLNRQLGPLVLTADPSMDAVEFRYAVGQHSGHYTVQITQGARQELLPFFVGPEPPTGQAGPVRHFNPDPS